MAFPGMDCSTYPGDARMQELKRQTNLAWTGFYLAPAPNHPDTDWMDRRAVLAAQGWGFAPTYLGHQQQHLTNAQGKVDGADAAQLAHAAHFEPGTVVYLDVEQGPPLGDPMKTYYASWVQSVVDAGYTPGIYCSFLNVADFIATDHRPKVWTWRLILPEGDAVNPPYRTDSPSGSSYAGARMWQYVQNMKTVFAPAAGAPPITMHPIDFSTSSVSDPSVP